MGNALGVVSDENFEQEVLASDKPVLVDFWAPWCQPCLRLNPVIEELANDYADKIKIVKLNVEDNTAIPSRFGIRGIPTLVLFKNGEAVTNKSGGDLSKAQLAALLDSNL
ncbi:MAG: thioredoxin [Francisellaceae bacterium]|jgi:thioredoxin 1|nr:thioredoxin [Francisellaceae bacterium]MBT6206646.1 thioredoxin [Francisellaceae bacterium]MBT6538881.1 thioredoxin [Francisellaceae bacterium]